MDATYIKKIVKLLGLEIKSALKFYSLFFVIMVAVFSATLTLFSVAVFVPTQYEDGLREFFPNGIYLFTNGDYEIETLVNSGADYIYVTNTVATNLIGLKSITNVENTVNNLVGEAHIFKDEINKNSVFNLMDEPIIEKGRLWNKNDNTEKKQIWLSSDVATKLNIEPGEFVLPTIEGLYIPYLEIEVIGIFKDNNDGARPTPSFIISYDLAAYFNNMFNSENNRDVESTAVLDIYDVIDLAIVMRNLDKAGISYINLGTVIDNLKAVNLSLILFWILADFMFLVGAFILFNLVAMIQKTREKTYARLKLLGIQTKEIVYTCLIGFLSILIFAFLVSIIVSLMLNNYFEEIAKGLFDVTFDIRLTLNVTLSVFLVNLIVFCLYYFRVSKRFTNISPLVIIAEEK